MDEVEMKWASKRVSSVLLANHHYTIATYSSVTILSDV
jgi:hypothetical protein